MSKMTLRFERRKGKPRCQSELRAEIAVGGESREIVMLNEPDEETTRVQPNDDIDFVNISPGEGDSVDVVHEMSEEHVKVLWVSKEGEEVDEGHAGDGLHRGRRWNWDRWNEYKTLVGELDYTSEAGVSARGVRGRGFTKLAGCIRA